MITQNFEVDIGTGARLAISKMARQVSMERGGRVIVVAPRQELCSQWHKYGYPITTTTPQRWRHSPILDLTEKDVIVVDESRLAIRIMAAMLQCLRSEVWLINCPIPMSDLPPSRWATRPWDPMPPELREQTEYMRTFRNRLLVAEINAIPVADTSPFDDKDAK